MLIENNGDLMADDNEKTNGEGREYLGICALWKSGKMLVSQNIRKRLDKDSGTSLTDDDYKKDENQVRLIVMTNQFKSNDLLKDGADAHLLLDVENYDEFLKYLALVKRDFDNQMANESGE